MFKNRLFTIVLFAGLLALTSVVTVFGSLMADLVSSYGKKEKEVVPANYPHLATNLQNDLNSAMSPEFPFNFDMAGNPFRDSSGASLTVNENKNPPAENTLGNTTPTPVVPRGSFPVMPVQNINENPQMQTIVVPTPVPTPQADSKALLAERNRQIRQGIEVGDLSGIYSIDDVRPIGMIGSGNQNRVWLYSPSTKQTFSVRKGTRFRDGTIESVTSEGVEFRRDNGTVANSRWMKRSEKSTEDADSPILRVEPSPIPVQNVQNLPVYVPTQPQQSRVNRKSKRN